MNLINIAPQFLWKMSAIGCFLLAIASGIVLIIPNLRVQSKITSAVLSWWPVVFVAMAATLLGAIATLIVVSLISCALVYEFLKLIQLQPAEFKIYVFLGMCLSICCNIVFYFNSMQSFLVLLTFLFLVLPVVQMLYFGFENYIKKVSALQSALFMNIGLLLFVNLIILIPLRPTPLGSQGAAVCFFAIVIVSDAMQYVGGKLFGRNKLIPHISPGKTREGIIFSSLVCGVMCFFLAPLLLGFSSVGGFFWGISSSVLGLAGDLIISAWKRDAGVKDTGQVLPGQGGVLDRCDSLLYLAPWFCLGMWFF